MFKHRSNHMAQQHYAQLCRMQKEGINAVWHNPDLTPQEALDANGTDAEKLFEAHGMLTQTIVSIAASDEVAPDILLPTHDWVVNEDGTITVGAAL